MEIIINGINASRCAMDIAEQHARRAAELDRSNGRDCDAQRHHARVGSAFAVWYTMRYLELSD